MLNIGIYQGRLTADPELQFTPNQKQFCRFRIACERDYKDKDGNKQADFLSIICWNYQAEFLEKYFKKGDFILVQGTTQTRTYEKDGQKRHITEILAEHLYFGGSSKRENAPVATKETVPEFLPEDVPPPPEQDFESFLNLYEEPVYKDDLI